MISFTVLADFVQYDGHMIADIPHGRIMIFNGVVLHNSHLNEQFIST